MIRAALVCTLVIAASPSMAASPAASSAAGGSSATSGGASASSNSTSGNNSKVVRQARDDAAGFVASDGRIRGARLEAAILHLRQHDAAARQASDMQLAKAILAL